MLFKKNFDEKTVNGVQMGNGKVSFRGIKLNVHCFYTDGILIDTGAKSLEKFFRLFFNQLNIEKVIMTHFHEDHTGGAHYLQGKQLPLYMSDIKIDDCKKKADYPLYRQLFWGKRKPFHAQPIGDRFQSKNGVWKAIKTPGHAIDHLAYLNEETGQLFTGDLYCQQKTKVVLREENIPQIIHSIESILTYDFDDVFCSHAGYLKNGRKDLQKKLEYLLELKGNVIQFYDEGKTPEQIQSILFPKKYPITFFSSGEWDSQHIVRSILRENEPLMKEGVSS